MWGGRFVEDVDPDFHNLNSSIHIDKRMYAEDIQVIFSIIDTDINFCNNLLNIYKYFTISIYIILNKFHLVIIKHYSCTSV